MKEEIQRRINNMLYKVFQQYEMLTTLAGKNLVDRYQKIKERFDRNLSSPAEFIEMEAYKTSLMSTMTQIEKETE